MWNYNIMSLKFVYVFGKCEVLNRKRKNCEIDKIAKLQNVKFWNFINKNKTNYEIVISENYKNLKLKSYKIINCKNLIL